MAPPLYFFPRLAARQVVAENTLAPDVFGPRGLTRTFADITDPQNECYCSDLQGTGPGGNAGCVFRAWPTNGDRPTRTGYCPENDLQTWTRFSNGENAEFWVGLDNALPPAPEDLARKSHAPGYTLRLGPLDLVVPVVRDPDGGTGLPRKWILEASGDVAEEVEDAYRDLWETFAGVVDLFYSPDDPSPAGLFNIDRREAMERSLQALAINYRIGRPEQNLLGLVNAENWPAILGATVDWRTYFAVFEDAQQKKMDRDSRGTRPESSGTSPGEPDDSPDTGQAEPS
jgi:hypothetical protein